MAKLKLAVDPTFKAKVGIPLVNGESADVTMTFKHRTRVEADELFKRLADKPAEPIDAAPPPEPTAIEGLEKDVDFCMQVATGWDLEEEFNRENVKLLLNNYFGAAIAVYRAYFDSLQRAKVKN